MAKDIERRRYRKGATPHRQMRDGYPEAMLVGFERRLADLLGLRRITYLHWRVGTVFVRLARRFPSGVIDPAYDTLSAEAGVGRSTAIEAVKRLEHHKMLDVQHRWATIMEFGQTVKRQVSNTYRLLLPAWTVPNRKHTKVWLAKWWKKRRERRAKLLQRRITQAAQRLITGAESELQPGTNLLGTRQYTEVGNDLQSVDNVDNSGDPSKDNEALRDVREQRKGSITMARKESLGKTPAAQAFSAVQPRVQSFRYQPAPGYLALEIGVDDPLTDLPARYRAAFASADLWHRHVEAHRSTNGRIIERPIDLLLNWLLGLVDDPGPGLDLVRIAQAQMRSGPA